MMTAVEVNLFPWNETELQNWSILAMYHYVRSNVRYLSVAMTWQNYLIRAEGIDEVQVFNSLKAQAQNMEGLVNQALKEAQG